MQFDPFLMSRECSYTYMILSKNNVEISQLMKLAQEIFRESSFYTQSCNFCFYFFLNQGYLSSETMTNSSITSPLFKDKQLIK